MGVRSGQQFIDGLKANPRAVWINGEKVEDVTTHPAFSRIVRQLARLYEAQVDPATRNTLTYEVPETGQRAGMAFMPAKTSEDLRRRRDAYYLWASMNFGLMGRSPDFLNASLLAFAEAREVFARGGDRFADNIVNYYKYIRDNDLFLSHALISPQNDRTKSSSEQKNLHMRVVKETDEGIYVQGARMVATLGAVADEMLMYCLPGIPESDADHALSFAVKVSDPGVKQICREPYTVDGQRSDFDHPLSNNFEENDSLLIFDNVFVPWERVFMYRDVALNNALYTETALRNYTAHQTNTRALVKLQFGVGVAMAVARSIGADQFLHVQRMLGEALNGIEFLKSGLVRSEVECEQTGHDTVRPALAPLQALRTFLPTAYPKLVETIQTIAAGGFMMMPSGAEFTVPELSEDTDLYYQGAGGMSSVDRARLFKLAWDLSGEAFGSRLLQYERYYAGDPIRTTASNYLQVQDEEMMRLVNDALALAGDPEPARSLQRDAAE
ncbi:MULTISPECIES: 4-hydroxyphenylacetate 3-hydroxylase family protein [Rhodobacterales]|uniref:4-hydroxyphenylacetate 3-hydroxylase n=1 Tax=Sulfitobacter alexandrii TaxID=1917485 RepID=A0A1J0WPD4_9RHOB|nr:MULTISPECIES: 4-hydroxyphenylacetate 3-hydroxylase N-terminal domain-containing protein [Rhodobacterales]APE46249.1 4-hydroxyphenylacetate 3-hydroxylase [Sulfitobacter alexandrii]MAY88319.1 4-hydroxyphenylacetate 3-hydroxylase [Pseudooceanicola sp.]|tara:strand:- start:682 stop:2175 length:1494 start_codon:yes stop_codon:yes gene_type:complete